MITVTVSLVPTHLVVGEETFNSLIKCYVVSGKLILFKVIFEV